MWGADPESFRLSFHMMRCLEARLAGHALGLSYRAKLTSSLALRSLGASSLIADQFNLTTRIMKGPHFSSGSRAELSWLFRKQPHLDLEAALARTGSRQNRDGGFRPRLTFALSLPTKLARLMPPCSSLSSSLPVLLRPLVSAGPDKVFGTSDDIHETFSLRHPPPPCYHSRILI